MKGCHYNFSILNLFGFNSITFNALPKFYYPYRAASHFWTWANENFTFEFENERQQRMYTFSLSLPLPRLMYGSVSFSLCISIRFCPHTWCAPSLSFNVHFDCQIYEIEKKNRAKEEEWRKMVSHRKHN